MRTRFIVPFAFIWAALGGSGASAGVLLTATGEHASPSVELQPTANIEHTTLTNDVFFSLSVSGESFEGLGILRYRHTVRSEVCSAGFAVFHTEFTIAYRGEFDPRRLDLIGRFDIATDGTEQDPSCPRHGYHHVFEPMSGEWRGRIDLNSGRLIEVVGRFGVDAKIDDQSLALLLGGGEGGDTPSRTDPSVDTTVAAAPGPAPSAGSRTLLGWLGGMAGAGGAAAWLWRRRTSEGWGRPSSEDRETRVGDPTVRSSTGGGASGTRLERVRVLRDRADLVDLMDEQALGDFFDQVEEALGRSPREAIERRFISGGARSVGEAFDDVLRILEDDGGVGDNAPPLFPDVEGPSDPPASGEPPEGSERHGDGDAPEEFPEIVL